MSILPSHTPKVTDPLLGANQEQEDDETMIRSGTLRKTLIRLVACGIVIFGFIYLPATSSSIHLPIPWTGNPPAPVKEPVLVPLEAHIISKCPDTRDCLKLMVLPTMQRVIDKVNFTLSYIGTPTDNDGVDCMHGPEECMGNIIELCAAKLYPSPKTYLGFTMCLTRDYQSIPQKSLIEDCALEHNLDFEELNKCSLEDNGGTGVGMLRDSVRRSIEAGVTASCTIRLNEEIYCIRDGGEWKDCPTGPGVNDLVIAIEKQYRSGS